MILKEQPYFTVKNQPKLYREPNERKFEFPDKKLNLKQKQVTKKPGSSSVASQLAI